MTGNIVVLTFLAVATGLQIARWARLDLSPDLEIWVSWRKVYRTLVFLEWYVTLAFRIAQRMLTQAGKSWLSATIGYQYDLSESEIEVGSQILAAVFECRQNLAVYQE
jgi:hypothetical protein